MAWRRPIHTRAASNAMPPILLPFHRYLSSKAAAQVTETYGPAAVCTKHVESALLPVVPTARASTHVGAYHSIAAGGHGGDESYLRASANAENSAVADALSIGQLSLGQ
jgi:hypothetical protein